MSNVNRYFYLTNGANALGMVNALGLVLHFVAIADRLPFRPRITQGIYLVLSLARHFALGVTFGSNSKPNRWIRFCQLALVAGLSATADGFMLIPVYGLFLATSYLFITLCAELGIGVLAGIAVIVMRCTRAPAPPQEIRADNAQP